VRAVPSAAATLAIAAPLALAGLPGPAVLTVGISGQGAPRAGHSYTYLVSVDDAARAPGWLVHLTVSAPTGTTVTAVGGDAGACRAVPGGAECVWPQLKGGSALGVAVTVSLGPGLRAGAPLAAAARLSYDWGQLTASATSVRTVAGPPPPRPRARPKPPPTRRPPPRSVPSSPAPRLASSSPPRVLVKPAASPSRVSPPSPPAPGSPLSAVRPHQVVPPSRTPPRPSRSPSAGAFFPRTASKLIAPPPSLPTPGLPIYLLLAVVLTPCVAAAVTRFGRGR
jgi:hypothetical protein